jgi:hypothetical protein
MPVCTVSHPALKFKSVVTNARATFAIPVTGVTNFKPTTRFASVIAAMPFTVGRVTKWISATTVGKWCVRHVAPCSAVNSVGVDCVKNVPRRVDGTLLCCIVLCVYLSISTICSCECMSHTQSLFSFLSSFFLCVCAIFMNTLIGLSLVLFCLLFCLVFIHTVAGLSFVVAMPNSPSTVIPVAYPTALSV